MGESALGRWHLDRTRLRMRSQTHPGHLQIGLGASREIERPEAQAGFYRPDRAR